MKKVININFQGRVIPIEETAYDMLKQYVESLRIFFANEEGRDEIINDIEGRIAELFGEILKKGSTCITDADVNTIINSMGRPEDFDADEAKVHSKLGGNQSTDSSTAERITMPRGRLYRSDNDKLLGGVCAGIASYLRVDPTIVRLIFAVITFGGFGAGILLYIILWIVLPAKSLEINLKKRLYRNPDDRVIGGVAGGLAAYFNLQVWVLRVIFALPIILGITSSIFQNAFFHFNPFPTIIFGSFGSTLFVIYVVLWIVIPEASTASERLEMRGEKVDLNSIKNTIKEEMEGFRGRAEKVGADVKQKATEWTEEMKATVNEKSRAFSAEAPPVIRKTGNRIGNAIGILFKAFFLFVSGLIVFALLMILVGIMIGGVSVFPLKDFFLQGFWQNFFAWATLLFFLGAPVIAFVTWLVRRIIGVKSKNKYLGYTFGGLWLVGLICGIFLVGSIMNDFNTYAREKQDYSLVQPAKGRMIVKVAEGSFRVYGRWLNLDGLINVTNDSIYLNRVRLEVIKSPDSNYHTYAIKTSNGRDEDAAMRNAQAIRYDINQTDSVLNLARGFALNKGIHFRNQGVVVTIEVPVGKRIRIDKTVTKKLQWFRTDSHGEDWDEEWDHYEKWRSDVDYVMTVGGLERIDKKSSDDNSNESLDEEVEPSTPKSRDQIKSEIDSQMKQLEQKRKQLEGKPDSTYRYKRTAEADEQAEETDATAINRKKTIIKANADFTINPLTSVMRMID